MKNCLLILDKLAILRGFLYGMESSVNSKTHESVAMYIEKSKMKLTEMESLVNEMDCEDE